MSQSPLCSVIKQILFYDIALSDKCLFLSAPSELIDSCNAANRNIALSGNSKF